MMRVASLALATSLAVLAGCAGHKGQYESFTVQHGGGRTGQAWLRTDEDPASSTQPSHSDERKQRYINERLDVGGRPTVRRIPIRE